MTDSAVPTSTKIQSYWRKNSYAYLSKKILNHYIMLLVMKKTKIFCRGSFSHKTAINESGTPCICSVEVDLSEFEPGTS